MQFSKHFALAVLLVNCGIADLDVHDDSMLFVRDVHDESVLFIQQKQSSTIETDEYEMVTADSTAASWRLGEKGASCDQVCSQDGGTCTENVWPTSQNEFDAIYSAANRDADCAASSGGGAAYNPSMRDDFSCFWRNILSSDKCGRSNSAHRRFCPCVPPAPIIQQCLSITTGSDSDDDGYLSLRVKVDGSYLPIASDKYYDHGVKVLDRCYDGEVNLVEVQNARNNAWVGRFWFYYKIDGKIQDNHYMYCYICSRTGVANEITVDGNSDSGDLANTRCYNGKLCHMRKEITLSPTASPTPWPTRSPTSSPTPSPTSSPTPSPTPVPTSVPTSVPTLAPTTQTPLPTRSPTPSPTLRPTPTPTTPYPTSTEADSCASATDLATLTSPHSDTTHGAADGINTCGSGRERIFYYDLPAGGTIHIAQKSNDYDSMHETRWGGSCPGSNSVKCTDDDDSDRHTWTNNQNSTQRVFFIVDAYKIGSSGNFSIDWGLACADRSTRNQSCAYYQTQPSKYGTICDEGKPTSARRREGWPGVRRRAYGGDAKDNCQASCGYCQALPAPVLSDAPHHALQLAENSLGVAGGIMRFDDIMEDDGTQLVMENVTEYTPFKANVTGLTAPNSSMAQISLGCGDKVEMVFSFLLASEPKEMDNFDFTVADLDTGAHERCAEMVEVVGYTNYSLYPSSSIQVEHGTPFLFIGTAGGSSADNPEDIETMTDEQKSKAVSFVIEKREAFTVLFSTTEPGVSSDDPDVVGYNGRRILFGFGTP